MEMWKDIKGYEEYYQVSSGGKVRSVDRNLPCSGYVRHHKGKELKQEIMLFGYKKVELSTNGKAKTHKTHRLVAQAFIPNPEGLPFVLHSDDDPSNNRVDNLRWGTQQDNMDDKIIRGRHKSAENKGVLNPNCKLTESEVLEIKKLLNNGEYTQKQIGNMFGVYPSLVSKINTGERWANLVSEGY